MAVPANAYWVGGYYAPAPYYAPYYRPRVVYVQPPAYPVAPPAYAPSYSAPGYASPGYVTPGYAPSAYVAPRPVRPRVTAVRPVRRARLVVPAVIAQPGRSPFEAAGLGPVSLSGPLPAIPPPPTLVPGAAPSPQSPAQAPTPAAPEKNVYPPERDYAPFTGD